MAAAARGRYPGAPMRRLVLALVLALVVVPTASAGILLGVYGNEPHFRSVSWQRSDIQMLFVSFGPQRWLQQRLATYTPVPMLALVPGSYGSPETANPRGIATGATDDLLFQINSIVAGWPGSRFYLRPFPEMNGYWETECAYNQDGSPRDANHATVWTRKAFARIAVIVRGGTRARIDAQLARLGLPPAGRDLPVTTPKLRMVWNPQGFGAPDLPGNSAQAYYPGDAYVDVVGDDLYDQHFHAAWAAAEAMYRAHPGKPFGFPEWGLWGIDDPQFVRDMAGWLHSHPGTEFATYYSGRPGSIWDLASKPKSRAAYRRLIAPLNAR